MKYYKMTITAHLSSNYFFLKEKADIWVTKTDVAEFLRGACASVSLIHVYIMNHWVLIVIDLKRGEAYEFNSFAVTPFKKRRWLNCNNVLSNSYKFYRASLNGPSLSKGRKELMFLPIECAQQIGGTECRYYVMRYMYEIAAKHHECKGNLQEEYIGRTEAYNEEEMNEVREQWAKFFRNKYLLE